MSTDVLDPTFTPTVFFWLALPVAIWAAWSDLARMRIPNMSVVALLCIFALAGFAVLPFDQYLYRWLHFVVVLVLGFVLNSTGTLGAGDAKFAAAAAPLFH